MPSGRDALFESLGRFRRAWVSHGWSWDRRLECAASTFDITRSGEARGAVGLLFPQEWTHRSVKSAPPLVEHVAQTSGGVRSDQLLFSTDEVEGMIVYGLWWPWGGEGTNISMRIGMAGDAGYSEMVQLRTIFGVLDD